MPISPKKRKNGYPKGLFREIFVSANRELAPFGMVFTYPPENFEQKQLGTVFGLIKISDSSPESSFVANLLASVIKKEYFAKPSRPAYDSFEASLKKANLALAELARQGSVKWIGHISFAGGALEKNNLHFSKLGTTSILLLRGGMLADIGSGLDEDTAQVDSHPIKTFSDISSGKVELGDRLVFTTSDLLEIFSFEEIRQNAARFSREEFPEIISASLTANSELSGAIVVSMVSEEEAEEQPVQLFTAKESKNRLIADLPEKQKSAAPSAIIPPKNIPPASSPSPAHAYPAPASPIPGRPTAKKEKYLFVSESEDIIPKKSFAEKTTIIAKNTFSGAKNGILLVWKKVYRLFGRVEWQKIRSGTKSLLASSSQKIRYIDFRKKNTKIGAVAGIFVVLALIAFFLVRNVIRQNAAIKQAQQSIQNAQPSDMPAAEPSDLNAKNIENISDVAALTTDNNELIFMNGMLFSLTGDKSISKIDPASGAVEKSDSDIASGKFTLAAAMPDLNTIFILTADKKVISFTPSNKKFQENNISFPDNLNASDIKAYLTYIYVLDSSANQIYRYPRAEGGFGEKQDWLKNGQDLKGADKFAINNDIFAANNLNIIPLLQGKIDSAIDFQKPQIPLRIDGIYTDRDFANILVLDNNNHRIVAFSKDGKIAAQYFSNQITGIKNMAVDEKNKVIYLENSDSVSKFSIE
ncbi:MAG TPA: hypothetical protein VMQ48_03245 [Candidatus Saccharimonadales bacterium]|nr:hypothetical protein [Candidatus Saccharimonadales bacterium]